MNEVLTEEARSPNCWAAKVLRAAPGAGAMSVPRLAK
jgi:hypothetical protein